jgi:hypothetical protein
VADRSKCAASALVKWVFLILKSSLPLAASRLRGLCNLINIIMWSSWKTPANIAHWTDEGIEFSDGDNQLDSVSNIETILPLYGISVDYNEDVNTYGAKGLIFTGFGFDSASTGISHVEIEIKADRLSRIVDDRVQLWNSVLIGDDVSDDSTENIKVYYGAVGAYWGVENIDPGAVEFGVLLDFAPRSDMPSSNRLVFRSVKMRVNYL